MLEFKTEKKPKIAIVIGGQSESKAEITFTAPKSVLTSIEGLADRPLTVTIKEYREKRSISQNSYFWRLCDLLGAKLNRSKEDIYKTYIKDYGVFEILPIRNDAVERFKRNWCKNGLGWFTDDLGESKLDGYTKLIAYYGSSTYNSAEMTRLIDAVIQDCKEQCIDTMPLKDIMLLRNDND